MTGRKRVARSPDEDYTYPSGTAILLLLLLLPGFHIEITGSPQRERFNGDERSFIVSFVAEGISFFLS